MEFSRAINENGILYVPYAEVKQQEEELKKQVEILSENIDILDKQISTLEKGVLALCNLCKDLGYKKVNEENKHFTKKDIEAYEKLIESEIGFGEGEEE